MDPSAIAAGVVAFLIPYVTKAGKEFAGAAGKAAWQKGAELLSALRARLSTSAVEQQVLSSFESQPDEAKEVLVAMLRGRLEKDQTFLVELDRLLKDAMEIGPDVIAVQRAAQAWRLTAIEAENIKRGTIRSEQIFDKEATDTTGIRVRGDIG